MTVNEAINKIKLMLSADEQVQESTTEQTFAEATLVDGTVVKVEGDLEVGKPLFVVTEEGDVPAPEGMHETVDGLIVTVDEAGVITNIEEKAAEEAPVEEEVVVEADKENFSEDLVNQIGEMIKPALEAVESLKSEIATLKGEFSAFKDEPAAKKITNNLEEFKADQQNFGDARFAQIQKIRADKFK